MRHHRTGRCRRCGSRHQTYQATARCRWKRAAWVKGDGMWALLAHCRGLSVSLHSTGPSTRGQAAIDQYAGRRVHRRHGVRDRQATSRHPFLRRAGPSRAAKDCLGSFRREKARRCVGNSRSTADTLFITGGRMTETQELLLRIMAITDAIWFPVPDWTTGDVRPKNVYLARQNFATGGVPVPSDAGDNAGRVAFTRLLQKAKADGLVTVSRTRSSPSAAMCKLTESGERRRGTCAICRSGWGR